MNSLLDIAGQEGQLTINDINYVDKLIKRGEKARHNEIVSSTIITTVRGQSRKSQNPGAKRYIQAIIDNDVVFGIGPAGTGKTYLAVVMAVRALKSKDVDRIILVRPAVEAGEKLGFLPGDFMEKVNPYLRPLYDGLFDILGVDVTQRYIERNIVEIAPLAYMRGRTLSSAFIILDEAQDTAPATNEDVPNQLGFGSKAVMAGDITQVDLPKEGVSGLIEGSRKILGGVEGVAFEYLTKDDYPTPLVQRLSCL